MKVVLRSIGENAEELHAMVDTLEKLPSSMVTDQKALKTTVALFNIRIKEVRDVKKP